jgi:hypothetical protein
VWAETPSGASQPFDRMPGDEKGSRVLIGRGPGAPPLAVPANVIRFSDEEVTREVREHALYTPHHATCPAVADYRKGK